MWMGGVVRYEVTRVVLCHRVWTCHSKSQVAVYRSAPLVYEMHQMSGSGILVCPVICPLYFLIYPRSLTSGDEITGPQFQIRVKDQQITDIMISLTDGWWR